MITIGTLRLVTLFVACLSLTSCAYSFTLPFGEPERENNDVALLAALLFLTGSSRNGGPSNSECSNASGMVICLPSGLAQ